MFTDCWYSVIFMHILYLMKVPVNEHLGSFCKLDFLVAFGAYSH